MAAFDPLRSLAKCLIFIHCGRCQETDCKDRLNTCVMSFVP
jgi:hypothetical protein